MLVAILNSDHLAIVKNEFLVPKNILLDTNIAILWYLEFSQN